MTKVDKNGQVNTQTVHVAFDKATVRQIKTMAELACRSLSAQVAWMVRQQLRG